MTQTRYQMKQTNMMNDVNAVSPVIAVILMVAITVVLSATVFVLVADIGNNVVKPAPSISFDKGANDLMVTSIEPGYKWSEFRVTGCSKPDATVPVVAGNKLTDCSGDITVVHINTNTLVYRTTF